MKRKEHVLGLAGARLHLRRRAVHLIQNRLRHFRLAQQLAMHLGSARCFGGLLLRSWLASQNFIVVRTEVEACHRCLAFLEALDVIFELFELVPTHIRRNSLEPKLDDDVIESLLVHRSTARV